MSDDVNEVSPAAPLLGREVLGIDMQTGVVTLRYYARADFANRHGTVQGGMLAAMLDSATGFATIQKVATASAELRLRARERRPPPTTGRMEVFARMDDPR